MISTTAASTSTRPAMIMFTAIVPFGVWRAQRRSRR